MSELRTEEEKAAEERRGPASVRRGGPPHAQIGMPAERSLLSRIVQGSKSFRPRRPRLRTSGSTVRALPSGSGISVGVLIASSSVPRRTFRPA